MLPILQGEGPITTIIDDPKQIPILSKEVNIWTDGMQCNHLYFINEEEIKEGDWFIFKGKQYQMNGNNTSKLNMSLHFKIIATTDTELRSDGLIKDPDNPDHNLIIRKGLPQPSQAFIEEYCRKGGIEEVYVEYEEEITVFDNLNEVRSPISTEDYISTVCKTLKLKVDSHNTITIHPIKEKLYTIDEVAELCAKAYWDGNLNTGDIIPEDWIKENL